jgi:CheY-like chemotaxis protein
VSFSGAREKRVLMVEDSPTIRKLLRHTISGFDGWRICTEVERTEDIPRALKARYPDLLTLDLKLPGLNGVEAMERFLAPKQIPTILVTSQPKADGALMMDALYAGAIDYLQKPESEKLDELKNDLLIKMEAALRSKWHLKKAPDRSTGSRAPETSTPRSSSSSSAPPPGEPRRSRRSSPGSRRRSPLSSSPNTSRPVLPDRRERADQPVPSLGRVHVPDGTQVLEPDGHRCDAQGDGEGRRGGDARAREGKPAAHQ